MPVCGSSESGPGREFTVIPSLRQAQTPKVRDNAERNEPNFPKKSSWPEITLSDTLTSRRPAFLRWLTTLRSMFARITCSIGNDRFSGTWCTLYRPEAQRLDPNCPSPTTVPRRRLHREYQTFFHHLLLETFQDLCPAVTANHTSTAKYDDAAFQDADGYPHCVGLSITTTYPLTIRKR